MPASPPRPPRVIFVNRFYRPDETATAQLLTDLAENLAGQGHTVAVVSRHPGGAVPREESLNGVHVFRVRCTRSTRGGLLRKAIDFASFYVGAMFRLLRVLRRGDALVALTDPPLLGIGAWICARCRGARLFHWVQDIYPELAIELAGQRWLSLARPLRNVAWRGAEHCVTLGRDMAAALSAAKVPAAKISLIPNWAPEGLKAMATGARDTLREEWNLTGKFVIAYSGNFGRVHDLLPVLDVAQALRDEPDVVFVFIGDGAQRATLEAQVAERRLTRVFFRPPQPRTRLAEALRLADLHLVTLRDGCERYVFPSKLYGIAAVGRPIVFLGPSQSEIARSIESEGFGRAFNPTDTSAIAAAIRRLKNESEVRTQLGRAAVEFHTRSGGSTAAAVRWSDLLAPSGGLAGGPDRTKISPAA